MLLGQMSSLFSRLILVIIERRDGGTSAFVATVVIFLIGIVEARSGITAVSVFIMSVQVVSYVSEPGILVIFPIVASMLSVVSGSSFLGRVSSDGSSLFPSPVSFALLDPLDVGVSLSSSLSPVFIDSVAHCLFVLLLVLTLIHSCALFRIIFGISVLTVR